MQKFKHWFFKNLAEQIIKIKPEYSVKEPSKNRSSISVFESGDEFRAILENAEQDEESPLQQNLPKN